MSRCSEAIERISRQQAERMREIVAQLGPYALPLVEALRDGQITLAVPQRRRRAPLDVMRRASRPVVLWIGDDDDRPTGPDGWRCALQAARWARSAMVHAAGGERQHYEAAVAGALLTSRMLLVETSSRHAEAWAKLLVGTPTLAILPRSGPHPIRNAPETVH